MADFYNDRVKELFGMDYLFPWQRLVIANALEGMGYFGEERAEEAPRRNLVILPTGAGKTLCFLMPALMVEGITLILYPLLALLNDQARRLREEGYEPVLFQGGQTRKERERNWRLLEEGKSRFILTNPETAGQKDFQRKLSLLPVLHLVVDEVHTVPQWGTSFRKGLLSTGDLIERGDFPVVTAFTATASPEFQERIGELVFKGKPFHRIMGNPDRANIHYHVLYTLFVMNALEELCRREEKPILIFCRTRAQTEETARYLQRRLTGEEGVRGVRFYHAGLSREEKRKTEEWFLREKGALLTATSAYGMGMDHRSLRTVIHRDIPYSVESYIQEAGRAGRSGDESKAFLLAPAGAPPSSLSACVGENGITEYVYSTDKCRRTLLMAALGWESDFCGGCDYCAPRCYFPSLKDKEDALLKLFPLYNRIFTRKEWVDFLKGYGEGLIRIFPGFGLLRNWERDQIGGFFSQCAEKGYISIPYRGIWKKRVIVKTLS